MQNSYDVSNEKSIFWKKNENVPGRPVSSSIQTLQLVREQKSPRKSVTKHRKTSSASSFQEFQDSTEDAWDIGDDDFCHASDLAIHAKVAESTAIKVLNNHSKSIPAAKEKPPPKSDATTVCPPAGPGIGIRQKKPVATLFLPPPPAPSSSSRLDAFHQLINSPNTDIEELRKLSWSGIPIEVRPVVWKLLSGYLPTCLERRDSFLCRRKEEYCSFIARYYDIRDQDVHHETYRQIHIDVPRMSPLVPLFQQQTVQRAFERILYILAIRHPASGYVQGMNDLVTPFFVVFLHDYIPAGVEVESYEVSQLREEELRQVEADSYWCMQKLLDGIQDNYTFAQPGIQKKVHMLKELIQRIDAPLHGHLRRHSIEYLQFSFRWMNNLLMRELPLPCTIRLWDTYLSEVNGFSTFHLYVCAAFLKYWSQELLRQTEFQGLMLTLQNLNTSNWGDNEISVLVAEAYRLKYMFDDAPNHLQPRQE